MNNQADKQTILIVDDKPANILSLETQLSSPNLEIITATSGNQALALLLKHDLALVLLDVQMPEMDGFETAELMRSNPKTRNIPIIFTTAINKEQQYVFRGYECGAVDYLFKPLDEQVLKSKVDIFLRLDRQQRELKITNDLLEAKVEERTADLKLAKEKAEAANNAKSVFLANMSHELRTPLHGILSFADLGISQFDINSKEKTIHFFSRIQENGQQLMVFLNSLLELSKLETGLFDFERKQHDIGKIAAIVIEELKSLAVKKQITIELISLEKTGMVCCDFEKIQQVFRNLLSNAIKYSDEGKKIIVSFNRGSLKIKHQNVAAIQTSVTDQGIGVPPEELDHIFDRFAQGSRTKTGAGGTGLGLAICKRIITGHYGKIWAEKKPMGTAFHFSLPTDCP